MKKQSTCLMEKGNMERSWEPREHRIPGGRKRGISRRKRSVGGRKSNPLHMREKAQGTMKM